MTEVTISARIPKEMERELHRLMKEEHLEKSAALRKLLHIGLDAYRQESALRLLAQRRATLSRAAEIAKITVWEMMALARDRRVVWVSDDLLSDLDKDSKSR